MKKIDWDVVLLLVFVTITVAVGTLVILRIVEKFQDMLLQGIKI